MHWERIRCFGTLASLLQSCKSDNEHSIESEYIGSSTPPPMHSSNDKNITNDYKTDSLVELLVTNTAYVEMSTLSSANNDVTTN